MQLYWRGMADRSLLESLPELVERGFITAEQGARIHAHYAPTAERRTDRSMVLFSVLGALLIGTGVVLLVAHNWDRLPHAARVALAFLPLAAGQGLCLFALLKRAGSPGWREGAALALSFGVAASLSLVAQIYHISSDLSLFYLTWAVLILGLVYLLRSFTTALLYLVLITSYAFLLRDRPGHELPFLYLPLFAAVLPFYWRHLQQGPGRVSTFWLSFFVAVSFAIGSQLFWQDFGPWHFIGVAGLALGYVLMPAIAPQGARLSPFTTIGRWTLLVLLFMLSGSDLWSWGGLEDLQHDLLPLLVMVAIGLAAYAITFRKRGWRGDPVPELFFAVVALVAMGRVAPVPAMLLANLLLLGFGVMVVRQGIASGSLGRMNMGLVVIAATIIARFFDLAIGAELKGLLSIAIGAAFLLLNLRLLRERKKKGHA
ncbi:MAG: DUF2157 domain-containing protein [Flavobacteriales bacterium]